MHPATITVMRDAKAFPDSHVAVINEEDLASFEAEGWTTKKPRKAIGGEPAVNPPAVQLPAEDGSEPVAGESEA